MMERALVQVAGPKGAGKTTLIEALLRITPGLVNVGRCVRDGRVRAVRETYPADHPELTRCLKAGASLAALLRIPYADARPGDTDFVYDTRLMEDYALSVILESEHPMWSVDLGVYVTPPLANGESLFRRVRRGGPEAHAAQLQALDELEQRVGEPENLAGMFGETLGERFAVLARQHPEVLEQSHADMLNMLAQLRKASPGEPTEYWGLAEGCEGIELAGLVIVNIHDEAQREEAGRLVAEVHRMRTDPELFRNIVGRLGSRQRITAVVANLRVPGDAGLMKAVARIKRTVSAPSGHGGRIRQEP